ncbi:hypothetical protein HK097_006976 [Rhizophlyctis rosea]|uniref:Copper transport protein n=1 Tax=Rhizophlyctis rosea TaxID=64517 RepID=A0AAD5X4X8_9FUNG|nr:hypothetical protein HK097_006976 [Rhizophlyctis rosea]
MLKSTTQLLLALASLSTTTIAQPLPNANITASLDSLCSQMPGMPGCTLRTTCSSSPSSIPQEYCTSFSLLADICAADMPNMSDCLSYQSVCKNSTTSSQCTGPSLSPIPSLPSTAQTTRQISSICTEMDMDGCDRCTIRPNATYAECDLLGTYSHLCKAMPGMRQCAEWKQLCSITPSLSFCSINSASDPVEMRMYFHTGIRDYILFFSWVPQNTAQYIGAVIGSILLGIVYEAFQVANLTLQRRREKVLITSDPATGISQTISVSSTSAVGKRSSRSSLPTTSSSSENLTPSQPTITPVNPAKSNSYHLISALIRGLSRIISATLAYLMMLVVMTYNVGLCIAIVVGLGIGSAVCGEVGRILAERDMVKEKVEESDLALCC